MACLFDDCSSPKGFQPCVDGSVCVSFMQYSTDDDGEVRVRVHGMTGQGGGGGNRHAGSRT
jgi:hypothetical protein